MAYTKKKWLDHIVDQNGAIIQQGTPVSAGNLNNIEAGVSNAHIGIENSIEAIRDAIPSGFTKLGTIDYIFMNTNPNTIKLLSDSVAFVNGYKVVIPAGSVINLDAPPTEGKREDLVFLEVWKAQSTDTDGEKVNWRLRVTSNVDFTAAAEGIGNTSVVKAWGGNTADTTYTFALQTNDIGLYRAGSGSTTITALKTADGYVYAIPLFKVWRRNSGGYGVNNANGSLNLFCPTWIRSSSVAVGDTGIYSLSESDYNIVGIGDIFKNYYDASMFKILSKNGSNSVTIKNIGTLTLGTSTISTFARQYRYDFLQANIVAERDIIDLRHQVSLNGFNYQAIFDENFYKLLRGELQTKYKTRMLKTYHGIRKTPIDANTLFYASLDGTSIAEVGGATGISDSYKPSPTGLGCIIGSSGVTYSGLNISNKSYTIDALLSKQDLASSAEIIALYSELSNARIRISSSATLHFSICSDISVTQLYSKTIPVTSIYSDFVHVRLAVGNNIAEAFVNGVSLGASSIPSLFNDTYTMLKLSSRCIVSDLSISNISRGSTFATLPQDFIDGYARIAPAFNEQRNIFSDAQISEYRNETVKASGELKRQFTITQATPGMWVSNDTLKLKGISGEIISGVIDSDTALAKITAYGGTDYSFYVDDTSKLSVSDTFLILQGGSGIVRTISAIDTTSKLVTFTGSALSSSTIISLFNTGLNYIVESTASSSSPIIKTNVSGTAQAGTSTTITLPTTFNPTDDAYNNLTITITGGTGVGQVRIISDYVGSTKMATVAAWVTIPDATSTFSISKVPVAGTWSNLGTTEATFTFGTLYALTNQDLYVEYSLNEIAGQGGINEILTSTLAGEYKGQKLIPGTVAIVDDFKNKIASDLSNPNIAKSIKSGQLQAPSVFNQEFSNTDYTAIATQDTNGVASVSTTVTGEIPQILLEWDIVKEYEAKYGIIKAIDKVQYAKDNIGKITINAFIKGTCPSGNKAHISFLKQDTQAWNTISNVTTSNTIAKVSLIVIASNANWRIDNAINNNGYAQFLLHTDASDGATKSEIILDHTSIEIELKYPTNYDVLVPENPRRDAGQKSNILLVRKETKEIQVYFSSNNLDEIATYGEYIPYQGAYPSGVSADLKSYLAPIKCFAIGKNTYDSDNFKLEHNIPVAYNTKLNSMLMSEYSIEHYNSYAVAGISGGVFNPSIGGIDPGYASRLRGKAGGYTNSGCLLVLNKDMPTGDKIVGLASLVNINGKMYIAVVTLVTNAINNITDFRKNSATNLATDLFLVSNNPLIK